MSFPAQPRNWKRVIAAGLVAGLAMGMVEMMLEAVDGAGFWAAPTYIAATILRSYQDAALDPAFEAVPVMLGLMGHMMNSLVFGVAFALLAARLNRSRTVLVVLGMGYAVVIFVVLWYLVVPVVDPVMKQLTASYFFAAHLMWGIALGAINGGRGPSARAPEAVRPSVSPRSQP